MLDEISLGDIFQGTVSLAFLGVTIRALVFLYQDKERRETQHQEQLTEFHHSSMELMSDVDKRLDSIRERLDRIIIHQERHKDEIIDEVRTASRHCTMFSRFNEMYEKGKTNGAAGKPIIHDYKTKVDPDSEDRPYFSGTSK